MTKDIKNNYFSSFLDKISIRKRLVLLVVFTSLFFLIIMPIVNVRQIEQKLYRDRKVLLSGAVEMSYQIIESYDQRVKTGELPLATAKQRAMNLIRKLSYEDGNGYMWIQAYDHTMLMHPKTPELEGKSFANFKDKKTGKLISVRLLDAVMHGGGFVDYYWTKPGEDKQKTFMKLSYMKGYKDWNWMIGTGVYIDDIQEEIQKSIMQSIGISVIISLFVIIIGVFSIGRSIVNPIENLTKISKRLADNDLTINIPEDNNQTEIGELNRSFKKFIDNLSNLIRQVNSAVEEVSAGSEEMSSAADQTAIGAQQVALSITMLNKGAQEQSNNVSESLGNINSINRKIQRISGSADDTVKLSERTEETANRGKLQSETAVNKINQLKVSTSDISMTINELGNLGAEIEVIVDLIKTIASQTNLLALNAAIEAARAGEHGKGFAVVAEEVKKLATQSATATDKITDMIKEIQNKTNMAVVTMNENVKEVEDGVNQIEEVKASLGEILTAAKETSNHIKTISQEVNRLELNSSEVAKMMENISIITEKTAASTEEIASVTEEQTASLEEINSSSQILAQIAENLQKLVLNFKV